MTYYGLSLQTTPFLLGQPLSNTCTQLGGSCPNFMPIRGTGQSVYYGNKVTISPSQTDI